MSISLYDITIPVYVRALTVLSTLLKKGEAYADEKGTAHSELLNAQLHPDMKNLIFQVQRASDAVKLAMIRIAGVEKEVYEDNEKSFQDLQSRISKTIAFLEKVPKQAVIDKETQTIHGLPAFLGDRTYTGKDYALLFCTPNFFFHVTTAYDILRMAGVPIGKADFLGPLLNA